MPAPVAAPSDLGTSSGPPQPARKRITSKEELQRFMSSDSLQSYLAFVLSLSEAVQGKKASDTSKAGEPSACVRHLSESLSTLSQWVDECPPVQQSLRYGNPAYRTWFARMVDHAVNLLRPLMPEGAPEGAAQQIAPYLIDSFGNVTRIDYGTGHETNFCVLLYCLARLGAWGEQDRVHMVLGVFKQYLELMRKIQTTYW